MKKRWRLAYLVSHPIQYQAPLLRQIAKQGNIDLTVYYCWKFGVEEAKFDAEFGIALKWDTQLLEGYRYKFLKNISPFPKSWAIGLINPAVMVEFSRQRYDALWVHGYTFATVWLALLTAGFMRIPVILRGESCLLKKSSGLRRILKRLFFSIIFQGIWSVLAIGKCNTEFYQVFGIPQEKIFFMPYAVDNQFFQKESQVLSQRHSEIKKEMALSPDLPVVLYAGKLIARKRPLDLLKAYASLAKEIPVALIFVGEGSEKRKLQAYCRKNNLTGVYFAGFKNQTEISRYYAIADIFVLPSGYEPWGLAINEAMNFALAIITTDKVAAAYDLVKSQDNGFVYPAGNIEKLKEHLKDLLTARGLREKMGRRSLEIISEWNYAGDAQGLTAALEHIDKG